MDKINLVEGSSYFLVHYLDNEMLIPTIVTLFYLGSNLLEATDDEFYFQGAAAYLELGQWDKKQDLDEYDVLLMKEDLLADIHDNESLREQLEWVSKEWRGYWH